MKTQTGVYWALYQWMLRGGPSTIAWFLGPELDRAFVLVEKWCDGEGDNPPVCPPELIRYRPRTKDDRDLRIEMVDGTTIQIKHTSRAGKNLTARSIVFGVWTEAATTSSPMDFVRLRGRIVQSRGQIYLDAVPEPRNWVKKAILDASVAEREEAAIAAQSGDEYRSTYRVVQLSSQINPWVDESEAAAFERDLRRIDPNIAAREAGGEWVDDRELLFPAFDPSTHTFDSGHQLPLEFLGLDDATEQASLRWFSRPHDHIVSVDVNRRPHTAMVAKVGVLRGSSPLVPRNWILVLIDVIRPDNVDSMQAACEIREHRNRAYRDAGIIIDATSALEGHNAGGTANATMRMLPMDAFRRAGFEVRGPMRSKHDGSKFVNPDRVDGTILCRRLFAERRILASRKTCDAFVYAMLHQLSEADGMTPEKKRATIQDRDVAAFTDALRYLTWPFFSLPEHVETGRPLHAITYG